MEVVEKLGYDITETQAIVLAFLLELTADHIQSGEVAVENNVLLSVLGDNGIDSLAKLKAKIKDGPGPVFWESFYEYAFKMTRESRTQKPR